jgi:DNA ligase (NAD+)
MATQSMATTRLNETLIELMEKLADIMQKQGEPFRARAYQKAQETIMSYPGDILCADDLKGKPNIGSTIMDKLYEYIATGTLRLIEREKTNPINILGEIYGVGPKKAKELVENGITTITQLRENQDILNDIQKVGLKYYEDILKRIPRSEVQEYKSIFEESFAKTASPNSQFEIVGSFRRGAQSSGDIDVIITSDVSRVFVNFVDELVRRKVIVEILSRGPSKCLVISKIPSSDSYRRVDFLYTTPDEYPFSVLYFTGSKIFNTVMRHQALTMGFTMNEHGLYKIEEKVKKGKVEHIFRSEKDIFDYLNMEYKEPQERIDGRAVVIIDKNNEKEEKEEETIIVARNKTMKKNENKIKKQKTAKKRLLIVEDDSDDENIVLTSQIQINKNEAPNTYPEVNNIEVITYINSFKKNGIRVLDSLNENQLSMVLRELNNAYYNKVSLMSDNEYDIIKDYITNRFPLNTTIHEIGAPIERNKVNLPYQMWSMDKIKPDTSALSSWSTKFSGPYVLSCKLDGVSGLYSTEGPIPKLYTRGDGKIGQDVSHLISYLRLPRTKNIVIRGEFIIPKAIFNEKYKAQFANPRNMVAGIINNKTINETIRDVRFVAYEVIKPIMKPSSQLNILSTLDVEVVSNKVENKITNEFLSNQLLSWRESCPYEIDGVIVTDDKVYERIAGNPTHAFAFKMVLSDQIAEAKVVDVIWSPSKDGYLKPRVQIEPISLGGVNIEYATGFNGAFISENKIGIGAVIELIRSGDVIPYIRKVVVKAENAKMPNIAYKWNETHIDIMLEDIENDETVKEKNITGFFKGIGVEGLSSGNVARIVEAGYDNVPKILSMTIDNFLEVDGFKMKMASKIYEGIKERINTVSLVTIMAASNLFGRGFSDKKLELIMSNYPTILLSNESEEQKIHKILEIKGIAQKTAESFVERIPNFIQFIKDANLIKKLVDTKIESKIEIDESHPLFGKTIVMTGFRDNEIQNALKSVGAKLGTNVTKNTFILLSKNSDDDTGKSADARRLGVQIMNPSEFMCKYF